MGAEGWYTGRCPRFGRAVCVLEVNLDGGARGVDILEAVLDGGRAVGILEAVLDGGGRLVYWKMS